jgi:GntR family transcriptional regulator
MSLPSPRRGAEDAQQLLAHYIVQRRREAIAGSPPSLNIGQSEAGFEKTSPEGLTSINLSAYTVIVQIVQLVNSMAAFHINITTGANTPIYRQIVDQVRLAVATGALPAGEVMPSVRQLAERLVINFNTVAKAYGELVRDGVLDSQQGKGFFVAQKRQIYSKAERLRRLRLAVDAFIHVAVFLDFTADEIRTAVNEKLAALDWGGKPTGA